MENTHDQQNETGNFILNDGGRAAAGYKGITGDCAARALAIASGRPYQEVYDLINEAAKSERRGKRKSWISSAREGVSKETMHKVATALGATWVPTMQIGTGCKVHLRPEELPRTGRHILSLSKHYSAWIEGKVNDLYDPSRLGSRCVYGIYTFPG